MMKICDYCKHKQGTSRCILRVPWSDDARQNHCYDFEGKDVSATAVRLVDCLECRNSRQSIGELSCNCREIEIRDGKCQQYISNKVKNNWTEQK